MTPTPPRLALLLLALVCATAGTWWAFRQDGEMLEDVAQVGDTGMTLDQTEELMRAIGYVQQ